MSGTTRATSLLSATFAEGVAAVGVGPCVVWPGSRNHGGYAIWNRVGHARRVARAVWEATDGPVPEGREILHSCDESSCIRRGHLRAGSHSENMAEMTARGRAARGDRNGKTTLSDESIAEMRRLKATGLSNRQLAARFGMDRSNVSRVCNGLRRT